MLRCESRYFFRSFFQLNKTRSAQCRYSAHEFYKDFFFFFFAVCRGWQDNKYIYKLVTRNKITANGYTAPNEGWIKTILAGPYEYMNGQGTIINSPERWQPAISISNRIYTQETYLLSRPSLSISHTLRWNTLRGDETPMYILGENRRSFDDETSEVLISMEAIERLIIF